jgi:hypothetical protein
VLPPQLVRAREIVDGVHIEEEQVRVACRRDLGQREDTDPDALMEADGAEIAGLQAGLDGCPAGRSVAGAERLHSSPPIALGEDGIVLIQPLGQQLDQALGDEGHVPGYAYHWRGGFHDGGVDAPQRTEAGLHVDHDSEVGRPARGVGGVGHQQGRFTDRRCHDPHQPVEDPFSAY